MNNRGLYCILIVLLEVWTPLFLEGQTQVDTLAGVIIAAGNEEPIINASVLLLNKKDSSIIDYALSREDGSFFLPLSPDYENTFLKITSIGFQTTYFNLSKNLPQKKVVFQLPYAEYQLSKIIVKGKQSIVDKGDTLVYNMDNYRDSTERKVSDLLQKLPGVEVSLKGDIKIYGRAIKKLLIDGDDLSDRNYQVLSQNLAADLVSKVEFVFHYLDNPLLADMFKSDQIAVNLILKEDKKRKLNATASVGVGTNLHHDIDLDLVGLYDKVKYISFFQLSDIGKPIQYINRNFSKNGDFQENSVIGVTPDKLNSFHLSYDKNDYSRFNNTSLISNKFSYSLNQKWSLHGSVDLPREDFTKNESISYIYNDKKIMDRIDMINSNVNLKNNHYSFNISGYPSSNSRLDIGVNFGRFAEEFKEFDYSVNRSRNERITHNPLDKSIFAYGNYTIKWNKKWVSVFNLEYGDYDQSNKFYFDSDSLIQNGLINKSYTSLRQNTSLKSQVIGITNRTLYKIGQYPIYFDFSYLSKNNRAFQVQEFDSISYENKLSINQKEFKSNLQYSFHIGRKYFFTLSFQPGLIYTSFIKQGETSFPKHNHFYSIVNIVAQKEWNTSNSISLKYSHQTNSPTILNYYDFFRIEDRYRIYLGRNDVVFNSGHSIGLSYKSNKTYPYFLAYGDLNLNIVDKSSTDVYSVKDNFTLARWLLNNQKEFRYSLSGGVEKLIDEISSTIKIKPSLFFENYENYLNDELRNIDNSYYSLNVSFKTGLNIPINTLIGFERSINTTKIHSDAGLSNLTFSQSLYYMDLFLNFTKKFKLEFTNSFYHYKSRDGVKSNYLISGFKIQFFPKNSRFKLNLRLHNLFNTDEVLKFNVLDYVQIINSSQILPRYLLFYVGYSF